MMTVPTKPTGPYAKDPSGALGNRQLNSNEDRLPHLDPTVTMWMHQAECTILKYSTPRVIRMEIAGTEQAVAESTTTLKLSEVAGNMLTIVHDMHKSTDPRSPDDVKACMMSAWKASGKQNLHQQQTVLCPQYTVPPVHLLACSVCSYNPVHCTVLHAPPRFHRSRS